ncbi:MAG: disulfide bond formation protein B [Legionellaceae bacterium]|nr:disulfide bond formation protein B [Legionellaceae bacterium]
MKQWNRIHVVLISACLILAYVFYVQWVLGLTPCPLCWMQRLCVFSMALSMGYGVRYKFTSKVWHFCVFFALAGLYFAGRQYWLESLPPEVKVACLPALDVLLAYFPWQSVLKVFFMGNADCGEVVWRFAGLSLAGWSMLYFIGSIGILLSIYPRVRRL